MQRIKEIKLGMVINYPCHPMRKDHATQASLLNGLCLIDANDLITVPCEVNPYMGRNDTKYKVVLQPLIEGFFPEKTYTLDLIQSINNPQSDVKIRFWDKNNK